jgi:hypothetical protein
MDLCAGSGTVGFATVNVGNRRFVGCEINDELVVSCDIDEAAVIREQDRLAGKEPGWLIDNDSCPTFALAESLSTAVRKSNPENGTRIDRGSFPGIVQSLISRELACRRTREWNKTHNHHAGWLINDSTVAPQLVMVWLMTQFTLAPHCLLLRPQSRQPH